LKDHDDTTGDEDQNLGSEITDESSCNWLVFVGLSNIVNINVYEYFSSMETLIKLKKRIKVKLDNCHLSLLDNWIQRKIV
jgi:hypothetical protein